MPLVPAETTILDELETALRAISTDDDYNYTYITVERGAIDHGAQTDYPTIEIRQLSEEIKPLANRMVERFMGVYVIVTHNQVNGKTKKEKEDIVSKMKQDILNRLTEAMINAEFTVAELIIFSKGEHLIEGEMYVQGGLAMQIQYKNYYQNF
jgi:hypothetical protein